MRRRGFEGGWWERGGIFGGGLERASEGVFGHDCVDFKAVASKS